jgi:ATP-binding protein involved in chromosome partitioning
MTAVAEKDVLAALSKVNDPELNRDLVSAGMIKNLVVDGGSVKVRVELTTPACPVKDVIKKDVEKAIRSVAGVTSVDIEMGAQVKASGRIGAQDLIPLVKNVVLVGAGKGGVGKSTVAVNLAIGLARFGAKVGLLDADFYGPSVPMMMGVSNQRPVSKDGKTLEPLSAHGVKLMSIGFLIDPDQAVIWRGPMLHGAVIQLLRDVVWGELDYLVVDLPPGTGDLVLTLAQNVRASGAVLVTTPQDVALSDVMKAKLAFDKLNVPILGVVENMSSFVCPHCGEKTAIFDEGGGQKFASAMGIPFLGKVPLDLAIREGGDKGQPISVSAPESMQSQALLEVATKVAGRVSMANSKVRLPVISAPASA